MKRKLLLLSTLGLFIFSLSSLSLAETSYTGVDVSKLKGFTVYPTLTEGDVVNALNMGANTFRIMIMIDDLLKGPSSYGECPEVEIDEKKILSLKKLVTTIVFKYGATVIIDRHETPGLSRWSGVKDFRLYWENYTGECYRNILDHTWRIIPEYFKHFPPDKIIYELLNEPEPKANDWNGVENQKNARVWNDLQDKLINTVRSIDTEHTIIAAPPYGWRSSSLRDWSPSETVLNDGKIAATFHFYEPHKYTMQWEAWDGKKPYIPYPNGRWNKDFVQKKLSVAERFSEAYPNLPLIITEFSVIRKSPGAIEYLTDVLDIFNKNGWGWTYHTYREKEYFLSKGRPYGDSLWELRYGPPDRMELLKINFQK